MIVRPVTSNNRISIPADYWKQIGVIEGMKVDISIDNHCLILKKSLVDTEIMTQIQILKQIIMESENNSNINKAVFERILEIETLIKK